MWIIVRSLGIFEFTGSNQGSSLCLCPSLDQLCAIIGKSLILLVKIDRVAPKGTHSGSGKQV